MSLNRKVVVVDDDQLMRGLLASVLEQAGFDVVTAANAADATRACKQTDPDALLVDIELGPGPTGLDFANSMLVRYPHIAIVFLSRVPDARFVGAGTPPTSPNIAWMRKQDLTDPTQLISTLERALRDSSTKEDRADLRDNRPLSQLSNSQLEVLRLMAEGFTNAEIAERRGTSVRAVEHLVGRTFAAAGITLDESVNPRVVATRLIAKEAALPNITS